MKLDDPELLKKPPKQPEQYVFKTLYCRNGYHTRCTLASCLCDCHTEDGKQLAHALREAEKSSGDNTKCYSATCNNRVENSGNLFCNECNEGNTPSVRATIIGIRGNARVL